MRTGSRFILGIVGIGVGLVALQRAVPDDGIWQFLCMMGWAVLVAMGMVFCEKPRRRARDLSGVTDAER